MLCDSSELFFDLHLKNHLFRHQCTVQTSTLFFIFDIAFVCVTSKTQTLTNTHTGELM